MATIAEIAAYAGLSPSTVSIVLRKKGNYSREAEQKVAEAVVALNHRANADQVTIRDVAALAHVSPATVSNVLNGYPVSDAYRSAVLQAIKQLNYHPPAHREGRRKRLNTVLVVDDFSNANLTGGILSKLDEQALEPVLLHRDTCDATRIAEYMTQGALGVIFVNCPGKDYVPAIAARFPTVQCGYYSDLEQGDIVSIDYAKCASSMVELMLQDGRKRVVLVEDGSFPDEYVQLCEQGFLHAQLAVGDLSCGFRILRSDKTLLQEKPDAQYSYELHIARLRSLYADNSSLHPDGFVFLSEKIALLYSFLLQQLGIALPEQAALGCLNASSLLYGANPKIKSVSQFCPDVGVEAVNQLIRRSKNPTVSPRRCLFNPTLSISNTFIENQATKP